MTSIIASYTDGWGKKKGEFAATRTAFEEIKRQLQEPTAATKAVELSLTRNDWIQREANTLQRVKLEELISAAFAISSWGFETLRSVPDRTGVEFCEEFPKFEMLAKLYFTNLNAEVTKLAIAYSRTAEWFSTVHEALSSLDDAWEIAVEKRDTQELDRILVERGKFLGKKSSGGLLNIEAIYKAAHELGDAAQKYMEQLTTPLSGV